MKKLSLVINLEDITMAEKEPKEPREITYNILIGIVNSYANEKRGLNYEEQRKFYKIFDLLDKAKKEKLDEIELDDDWVGFLRKCMHESKTLPSRLVNRVFDLIDAIPDR